MRHTFQEIRRTKFEGSLTGAATVRVAQERHPSKPAAVIAIRETIEVHLYIVEVGW